MGAGGGKSPTSPATHQSSPSWDGPCGCTKGREYFFHSPPPPELKSTVEKHPGSLGRSASCSKPKPYDRSQSSFTLSASIYQLPAAATFPPSSWWVEEIPRGALGVTRRRGEHQEGSPPRWGRGRVPESRVSGMRGHELRCFPGARGPGLSRVWGGGVRWGG